MAKSNNKKSKKKLFIFGGLGLLVLILIAIAIFGGSKEEIVLVQVEKVQKRDITQIVTATGKIDPEFKVVINPEVTGEIIELPVKEGDYVKKGDLLIRIKGNQYKAQKERMEANLEAAQASLKIREAELNRLKKEYARVKELHSKELASDSELETAQSNYLTAKASHEQAGANVLQAEAQLREIMDTLNKTAIYAPMDGTVTNLNVELGERVLGSGFSQGTNIMTVSDLNNIQAVVDVDENDVVLVSIGDTAVVQVDASGDREFRGTVTEIGNSAKTSGLGSQEEVVNFEVKVKLFELDPNLRPGMSCTADIQTETVHDVISVPIQSVTARTEFGKRNSDKSKGENKKPNMDKMKNKGKGNKKPKQVVFVVDNNTAKMIEVKTGISDDNYIEIKHGLDGGEKVISGSYRAISRQLKDGSKVRIEEKHKFGRMGKKG